MDDVQAIQLSDTPHWLYWTTALANPHKSASRRFEPCKLRIVRAQTVERRRREEGGGDTASLFVKEDLCGELYIAKVSEARYPPGLSLRSDRAYFISHVVWVPVGGEAKLGSLSVYPQDGQHTVKVTSYRGPDKNFVLVSAPVGFSVAAR